MLAGSGAVRETAMDNTEVACAVGAYLLGVYPEFIQTRYGLSDLPADGLALLEALGRKRGCLIKGGEIDLDKAAGVLLRELRAGQIGRISLEMPPV